MWIAVAVFAITYLAMAGASIPLVRIDRPAAALCGAVAMVIGGVLSAEQAFAAIDLRVLTLLAGVMILAAYLEHAQFFRHTAWLAMTRASSPRRLIWVLVFVAGGLSALILNDTVCLMFTPLVVAAVVHAELPPLPYLLALASATNIGGVITFTGNPQNVIIGQHAAGQVSYLTYLALALPAGLACLAANAALICWLFRRELDAASVAKPDAPRPHLDRALAIKGLVALVCFAVAASAGVSLAGAAITAAAGLILVARTKPRPVLARVDWSLLLLFAGLFIVVRGLDISGALMAAKAELWPLVGAGGGKGDVAFVGLAVLGSNLVSNVPYAMIAVEWVPAMGDPAAGYVMLAFATTLAGNLTMFGSIANIIVFELAGAHGHIGFWRFLRYGAAITAVSLLVAFGILSALLAVTG